jgi:hypothetical protein
MQDSRSSMRAAGFLMTRSRGVSVCDSDPLVAAVRPRSLVHSELHRDGLASVCRPDGPANRCWRGTAANLSQGRGGSCAKRLNATWMSPLCVSIEAAPSSPARSTSPSVTRAAHSRNERRRTVTRRRGDRRGFELFSASSVPPREVGTYPQTPCGWVPMRGAVLWLA